MQRIHRHLTRPLPAVAAATTALVLAEPALGHLTAEPAFLAVGSRERIVLTVHNDRDATMTGFRLTVPEGFRIAAAGGDESWNGAVDGATASWTGGTLAGFRPTRLEVELEVAGAAPGPAVLRGDQLYPDDETVSWPVTLTVVPAGSDPGDDAVGVTAIVILSILGLLVVGTFALVFWQRRRGPRLQER